MVSLDKFGLQVTVNVTANALIHFKLFPLCDQQLVLYNASSRYQQGNLKTVFSRHKPYKWHFNYCVSSWNDSWHYIKHVANSYGRYSHSIWHFVNMDFQYIIVRSNHLRLEVIVTKNSITCFLKASDEWLRSVSLRK